MDQPLKPEEPNLEDEISSLLNELKEEDSAEKSSSHEEFKKEEIVPYETKHVNRLKAGGKLIFKKRNILGVDIGSASIKVVQVDASKSPPLIYGFAVLEIPFNLREKSGMSNFVIENLKKIIKKKSLFDSIAVSYVSGNGVYVYSGMIDKVADNELLASLKPVLEEKATFDLDETVIQYEIKGETSTRQGEKWEIGAVAAKKEVIKNISWLIEEAGLQINGLTVSSYAFENIFRLNPSIVPSNVIVINFGAKRTEINYYREGKFMANREISVAGMDINKLLTNKVSIEGTVVQLTAEQAEFLKRKMGISRGNEIKDPVISRLCSLYRPILEKMAGEIKRSLSYFQRSAGGAKMDRVYIVGGGANVGFLKEFFIRELEIEIEFFPIKKYFKIEKGLLQEEETEVLNTIIPACGLFFEKSKMNLVPGVTRVFSSIASYKHIWNLVMGGTLLCMCLLFLWFHFDKKEMEQSLLESKEQLLLLDRQAKQIEDLRAFKQHFSNRKHLVESLILSGPDWYGVIYEMSRITPAPILYESLEIQVLETEGILKISGVVNTENARLDQTLSELMNQMEQSPYFKAVELIKMEQNPVSKTKIAQFEIKGWLLY